MRPISKFLFVICFAIALVAAWFVQISTAKYSDPQPEVLRSWEYRFGDPPYNNKGLPIWPQGIDSDRQDWTFSELPPYNPPNPSGEKTLWMRVKVPKGEWRDPSLMLEIHDHYDMFTDKGLFYTFGAADFGEPTHYPEATRRLIPLPQEAVGDYIYISAHSGSLNIGVSGQVLVGSQADFIVNLFRRDIDELLLGFLYVILGIVFYYSYSVFRGQRLFVSFANFALFFGVNSICRTSTVYFIYDNASLWISIEAISLNFGIVGLIMFLERLYDAGPKRYIRRLWQLHLVFAAAAFVLVSFGFIHYAYVQAVYCVLILLTMALVLPKLLIEAGKGESDSKLIMLGCLALCSAGTVDIMDAMSNTLQPLPFMSTLGLAVLIVTIFMQLLRHLVELMLIARNSEKLSMVSQLAAGVAHEIRNPISVISGFVQLLKKDPTQVKHLDLISSEVNRMNGIVSDFLLFSKPSKESQTLSKLSVSEIVEETLELFKADMIRRNIELVYRSTGDIPKIQCDASQLKQVFINIIKNGIESMDHAGKLTVLVQCDGDKKVRVTVKDQGVGITPEELQQIGQPFFTTKEHGTGLGLMISVKYLEYHGGTMQFRSKVMEGTTVDIMLPVNTNLLAGFGMSYKMYRHPY